MGGGFRAGLRTEGVGERGGFSGQASVTLAVQDGGLQIWRSRLSGPVVALAWPDVDAILAGSAAAQNATTRPAIIIRTRRGALLPVILAQKPSGSLAPASAQQTMQAVHRLAGMLGQHRG